MIGELIGTLMAPLIFVGLLVLGLVVALLVRLLSGSEEQVHSRPHQSASARTAADNELPKII